MPRFLRAACRGASRITCLNTAERDFLVDRRWAPPSRIVTVGHGVRDEFFVETAARDRPLRTLLFVAQWLPMKGIDALATAFTALARRHDALRLVCAGTLMTAERVLSSFPEDVRTRVSVLPRVDQSRLAGLYRDADGFVFPSSYEGFGLALVEAMAAGLPIVTTPVAPPKSVGAEDRPDDNRTGGAPGASRPHGRPSPMRRATLAIRRWTFTRRAGIMPPLTRCGADAAAPARRGSWNWPPLRGWLPALVAAARP